MQELLRATDLSSAKYDTSIGVGHRVFAAGHSNTGEFGSPGCDCCCCSNCAHILHVHSFRASVCACMRECTAAGKFGPVRFVPTLEQDALVLANDRRQPQVNPSI